jgi:hypothetical protein
VSGAQKPNVARFSIQIADLDYLPLSGGAGKESCRLQTNYQLGAVGSVGVSKNSLDVSKSSFDLSGLSGGGAFPAAAASATEVPLFYMIGNTDHSVGGDTPAQVVARNNKADILVVSLSTPK